MFKFHKQVKEVLIMLIPKSNGNQVGWSYTLVSVKEKYNILDF